MTTPPSATRRAASVRRRRQRQHWAGRLALCTLLLLAACIVHPSAGWATCGRDGTRV